MIKVNCKRHRVEVPELGTMENAPTPNYADIESAKRLTEDEMCWVLEKKISDSNILKMGSEQMNKFLNKILDGIVERVIAEFLSPEKIAEYINKGIELARGAGEVLLGKIVEAAEKSENKIDDVIVEGILKAIGKK